MQSLFITSIDTSKVKALLPPYLQSFIFGFANYLPQLYRHPSALLFLLISKVLNICSGSLAALASPVVRPLAFVFIISTIHPPHADIACVTSSVAFCQASYFPAGTAIRINV